MRRILAMTSFDNCSLENLEGLVKTYMNWMSVDASAWKGHLPDYMDIDTIEAYPMSASASEGASESDDQAE